MTSAFSLISCGNGGNGTYSVWLYNAQDSSFYKSYNDNPVLKYLQTKTYADKNVEFDFWVPAAGSQQNNYDTMLGSGDYPVMMQNSVSDPAPVMYENGHIMDITDLVKENMPTYYARIQESTSLKNATTYNVDGKERIFSITTLNEDIPYSYFGPVYRRDWLVKYGKNPKTGAKFTGGYKDASNQDSWTDDVVFPSGETSPKYISDWEWMFDIFKTAQTELGITGSYAISEYYSGYTWGIGGLNSSFGESNPVWYQSTETGRPVKFGGTSESMRSYFKCLSSWYQKGYLDHKFNERTQDAFYSIDTQSVRLGKVGMWIGLESDLGGRLDLKNNGYTDGIYVAGCSWPINDVYGDASTKNHTPNGVSGESLASSGFFLMKGADKYDLKPLLTFLDYLYTEEGAVLRTLGLSKEQLATLEDQSVYNNHGMSEGAYTKTEDGRYRVCDAIKNDAGGLSVATSLDKFPGYNLVSSVDRGYEASYEASLQKWSQYGNSILIWGSPAQGNMSSDDSDKVQSNLNKVLDYMTRNAYKYIIGDKDPNSDADWSSWCSALSRFNVDSTTAILQKYCSLYPVG